MPQEEIISAAKQLPLAERKALLQDLVLVMWKRNRRHESVKQTGETTRTAIHCRKTWIPKSDFKGERLDCSVSNRLLKQA
jgi:hypothetical protein